MLCTSQHLYAYSPECFILCMHIYVLCGSWHSLFCSPLFILLLLNSCVCDYQEKLSGPLELAASVIFFPLHIISFVGPISELVLGR